MRAQLLLSGPRDPGTDGIISHDHDIPELRRRRSAVKLGALKKDPRLLPGTPAVVGPVSVLGREMTVYGRLDSTGEVHVHGIVSGDINAPKVTLWPDGYVEGNILAGEAHIHGHLRGRAIARMVVIGASATIEGQVFHHKIDMAKGAHIDARFPWRPVNYFEQLDQQLQQIR